MPTYMYSVALFPIFCSFVYCEDLGEKWPRYNGPASYMCAGRWEGNLTVAPLTWILEYETISVNMGACSLTQCKGSISSFTHYDDVIMTTMASQITSLAVVYSSVYSDADQRKHQSSASLAFVWGIHRDRWIPRTKDQLRGKCFHLMTSSCATHTFGWVEATIP